MAIKQTTKKNPFATKIFSGEEERLAKKWFREKLIALTGREIASKDMSDLRYRGQVPLIGRMVYYKYQAKYDGKLPYWDKFPLVIMVDETSEHFLGMNLHYLPPKVRGTFLTRLMDVINNSRFDKSTKLKITYGLLKSVSKYRYFQPCLKRYIKKNLRSNIMIIRPSQWHLAIHLPVARFKGATEKQVWTDSRKYYR